MTTDTRYRIIQWGKTGSCQGAKWGFVLSVGYMLVTTLLVAFVALTGLLAHVASEGNATDAVIGLVGGFTFLLVVWCVGLAIGVFPAVGVGIVAGWVVGTVVAFPAIYDNPFLRRTAGVATVLTLAYGIGIFLLKQHGMTIRELTSEGTFYYFIGMPFLFFVGTMLWLSDRLPRLAVTPLTVETLATERPVLPPLWLD